LSTFDFGIDAELNENISGHVLVLWEEDDTEPIDLDEGFITLTGPLDLPLYLVAGKFYVPFGKFDSFFISDPFTLELSETSESAVAFGFAEDIIDVSIGGFNGDVDKIDKNDHVESFFGSAMLSINDDHSGINLSTGISYISNIADSDGLSAMNDLDSDGEPDGLNDYVDGISVFVSASLNNTLFCIAEYAGAMDEFEPGDLDFADKKSKPKAWNIEIALVFPLQIGLGIQYQGSDDCNNFLPESSYGGIAFCHPFDNTYLGLEYLYQEYEKDDRKQVVTAQLAYNF